MVEQRQGNSFDNFINSLHPIKTNITRIHAWKLRVRKSVLIILRTHFFLLVKYNMHELGYTWWHGHALFWRIPWWRHQMKTFSALLAICAGNSPVPGEFPAQRPVTWSFDVLFDLRLNKRSSKQSWGWWFETTSRPLWRHRNPLITSGFPAQRPLMQRFDGSLMLVWIYFWTYSRVSHDMLRFQAMMKNRVACMTD